MIMTRYELEQGLNALYKDLKKAEDCDEETAKRVFNTDSKAEIIEVIKEEIGIYEAALKRFDDEDNEDDGMDYDAICAVQGLSRYA
jgi:ribosome maturation protein Sdo1